MLAHGENTHAPDRRFMYPAMNSVDAETTTEAPSILHEPLQLQFRSAGDVVSFRISQTPPPERARTRLAQIL